MIRTGTIVAWGLLMLAACCSSGCTLAGAVAQKTLGNPKVKPEYAPPQQPMLVLVESYGRSQDLQPAADELANQLTEELKEHKVAPLIENVHLLELRSEKPAEFNKMKIPEVGRALGATQVLYVDLRQCEVMGIPASDEIRGKVEASVRIVDVATGQTKWPTTGEGHTMSAATDYVRKEGFQTPIAVRDQMLEDLAIAIGRLFYTYEPEHDTGRGIEPG